MTAATADEVRQVLEMVTALKSSRAASARDTEKTLPVIRPADVDDIPALVELENRCFDTDRLSRRRFHWMLTKAKGTLLVAEISGRLAGYVLVLYHKGTSLARLYSIALDADFRGYGAGRQLLEAAEAEVKVHDCVAMRLEVRPDNRDAISLYKAAGYHQFDVWPDYYEDQTDALRFEKRMQFEPPALARRVPFYPQSTDFTCGPAALMMAMKTIDPEIHLDRRLELQLWREATTIFMTTGHGGCGPRGLALSAWRRGFDVEVHLSEKGPLFIDGVRSEEKKEVLRLVHEDFVQQMKATGIRSHTRPLTVARIDNLLREKSIPIVLISSYHFGSTKSPHWIIITGIDDRFVYAHDPEVDVEQHKSEVDCMNVPIPRSDYDKMARFGRSQLRAAVVISRRGSRRDG